MAVPRYDLYVESGPQRKKTLVHVLDLPACVVQADTTDEALAAAPEAIRSYLRYLERHGERVDPGEAIQTRLAEHNTEGMFSGQAMWPQDLKPVAPAALARYTRWLDWSRADLLALVNGIDEKGLRAKPAAGRSLRDILLHVLGADKSYVYGLVGPLKVLKDIQLRTGLRCAPQFVGNALEKMPTFLRGRQILSATGSSYGDACGPRRTSCGTFYSAGPADRSAWPR